MQGNIRTMVKAQTNRIIDNSYRLICVINKRTDVCINSNIIIQRYTMQANTQKWTDRIPEME